MSSGRVQDKAWEGKLVELLAVPMFTIVLVAFSIGWGSGVIALWHNMIRGLPGYLSEHYRPFSAIPRLIVLSFGLTALALILGKLTSPQSPIPVSPRLFAVNALFDGFSIIVAWILLREEPPTAGHGRRQSARLLFAILRFGAVAFATGIFAVLSLYLSVLKTPNEVPIAVALNTLIARPTPPVAVFSLKLSSDRTLAENVIEQNEKSKEDKVAENMLAAFFHASETGSQALFDRIEQRDGKRFSAKFREQFGNYRQLAAINYYGRSGSGPYFWLMHTTMFPVLVVLTIMLLNASTFFLGVMAASWALRVSRSDKPYSFISVCCALCAAVCAIVVFLTKP
jgi:hypothetical protein